VIDEGVHEANDNIVRLGQHRHRVRARTFESHRPHRESVTIEIAVQISVRVGAPVVTSPAVGM